MCYSRILTGAPIWVWPLLVVLFTLGLIASKDRTRSVVPIYFFWLLGLLSVNAVRSLPATDVTWAVFGAAYFIGAVFGFGFQKRIIVRKEGFKITLKGEWLSMIVMMTLFWMNFVTGVVSAISPETIASFGYHAGFATVAGLAAGSFIGRSLSTLLTSTNGDQNPENTIIYVGTQ